MASKQFTVIRILNPFDPKEKSIGKMDWVPSKTLSEYFPMPMGSVEIVLSVNGKIVPTDMLALTYLGPEDNVVVCPVPQGGGGGDDKSIFRMVAMIAVSVFAPYTAGALNGAMGLGLTAGSIGMTILTAGISFAGSMLVNALMPNKPASEPSNGVFSRSDLSSSPSYGIDGAKNVSAENVPVPVVYGTFRMGGNAIAAYVENTGDTQILYMLFNAGEGPIAGISGIQINDQPITSFADYEVDIRTGTPDQTPIPWFNDTIEPKSLNQKLGTGWTEYQTSQAVDKLRVDVSFPQGLFAVNTTTGESYAVTVDVEAEYRLVGDVAWTPFNATGVIDYTETTVWAAAYPIGGEERVGDAWYATNYSWDDSNGTVATRAQVGYVTRTANYSTAQRFTDMKRAALRRSMSSGLLPQGVYDIRIRRTTAESTSQYLTDTCYVTDVNEIITDDVRFRHTALLGLKIRLSDQLSSLPKVTYLTGGRLINEFDFDTETWVTRHSVNPAFIVLDMMTNKRLGAGISQSRFDMPAIKDFARHCIDNGLTFNGVFDVSTNIWDSLQYVTRCGHAQLLPIGTRYTVVIEREDTPSMMFSVSNMIKGSFKQNWLPTTDRANEIEVSFFDQADDYKQKTIKVYDPAAIAASRPARTASITLYGVVEAARAYREGTLQLNLNRHILQTVEFSAPIEAIACTVGSLIYVQHDMPQWGYAGRMETGSTASVVSLDREVSMELNKQYKLMVVFDAIQRFSGVVSTVVGNGLTLTGFTGASNVKRIQVNGKDIQVQSVYDAGFGAYGVILESTAGIVSGMAYSLWDTDVIEERDVVNYIGTFDSLTLQTPLPSAPTQYQHWMFGEVSKVKKPFRVRAITGSNDYKRDIVALEYNESVYDLSGVVVPTINYSDLTSGVEHVTIQSVGESLLKVGSGYRSKVTVYFDSTQANYRTSRVFVSKNGAPFEETLGGVDRASVDADQGDTIEFKVVAQDTVGAQAAYSSAPTITHLVVGKTAPPSNVTNFVVTRRRTDLLLTWDAVSDPDLLGYEIRVGESWDNYQEIVVSEYSGTMHVHDQSEAGTYYYHICAVDDGGRYSDVVNTFAITLARPSKVMNLIDVQMGDRVELKWDANPENNIAGYEIREGVSFGTSIKIGETDSNRFSVPSGSTGTRVFWVIAIAAPGIYGELPAFVSTDIATPVDKNQIVSQDEHALTFTGTNHYMTVSGGDLTQDDPLVSGEYIFDVDLGYSVRATNSLFLAIKAIVADTITWTDATFAWNSASATRPWEIEGNINTLEPKLEISRKTALQPDESDGWHLDNSLVSEGAVSPSTATGVAYGKGRYSDGVLISDFTSVEWTKTIPSQFSIHFWAVPQLASGELVFWTATTAGSERLEVVYNADLQQFRLTDNLGKVLTVDMPVIAGDPILIGISQTATTRRFMVGRMKDGLIDSDEAAFASVGGYTKIRLY